MSQRLVRNVALDGARTFAVADVIAGHLRIPGGGAQGVTVFFVISGYLITGLLLSEREKTGTIRAASFYLRRFARLGPALVVAIAAYLAWVLANGYPAREWWTGLVGAATYTEDIVFAAGTGVQGPHMVFAWAWSLGIEEQFYLVWPLLILLLLSWSRGRRTLAGVCGAIIVAAWAIRAWISLGTPTHGRLYYSFDTHMDAIAWGALLAVLVSSRTFSPGGRRLAEAAFPAAVVLAGLLLVANHHHTYRLDPDAFGLTAVVSATLVGSLVIAPRGILATVLSWGPLVYLGRISYGLYLWNYLIVLVVAKVVGHGPRFGVPATAGALLLTVAVAALSFSLIEQPLRRRWAPPRAGAIERDDRPDARLAPAGAPAS